MNTDRIEEIQRGTAYPDSVSVQQALLQVWNEVSQEARVLMEKNAELYGGAYAKGRADMAEEAERRIVCTGFNHCSCIDGERCASCRTVDEILEDIRALSAAVPVEVCEWKTNDVGIGVEWHDVGCSDHRVQLVPGSSFCSFCGKKIEVKS